LDDLRGFARQFNENLSGTGINHGESSVLLGQQAVVYQKLTGTYPFLAWGLSRSDGPSINDWGKTVDVDWGGPMAGHWGFSVSVDGGKIDPDPDMRILRMSDDIYFYHGD
jgi:hypothetical protein